MSENTNPGFEPVAAFAEIARALTESLELPEVLRRIASEMLKLTRAQGVSVIMPRGEMAEFVVHESPPPHSKIPVGYRFRPQSDLSAILADRREPLVILDLQVSPLIPDAIKRQIEARDLILVPLRVDEELLGALIIAFNELPEQMPGDAALIRAVGDQAAVAIRNAQLYEAARTASEQLVQAEQLSALGKVVARVAHQLNNPLTTVRLLAEGLEVDARSDDVRERVKSLGREVERAAMVVQDLLLFVRKGRREFHVVDVAEVVRDAIAGQRRRLAVDGVSVATEVGADLPAVHGDARALRQVLGNLLHNAAHALATTAGERRIVVRAHRPSGADTVELDVEDTGPGIPPELTGRVFEPFFTTKPIGEGTGLGLAIARDIIEVHGGALEIGDSTLGGAAFRIRLPAQSRPAAPAGPAPGSAGAQPERPADGAADVPVVTDAPAAAAAEAARRRRLLVIDDEAGLQRALRNVLEYLGCEVTAALDGEQGLSLARTGSFDLILCDIRVPGLAGPELYDRLLAQAPDAAEALIFMTGDSLSEEVRTFLTDTGRPFLAKPFGRAQLEELLRATAPRDA